jgi:glutathione S-transferase
MFELYHWEPNGYCLAALMTLYEKGAEFKSRYVDFLALEQYRLPAYTGSDEAMANLEIEGPLLMTDKGPVVETFFMGLYVDQVAGGDPLAPRDPFGHYNTLAWARHIGEMLAPSIATLGCESASKRLKEAERSRLLDAADSLPTFERRNGWNQFANGDYSDDLIADSRRKLALSIDKAEKALSANEWLLGDRFTNADIEVFTHMKNAVHLAPDLFGEGKAPKVKAWLARLSSRSSYTKALAHAKTAAPETAFVPGPEHSRWG